jgi:hypothetical protein
MSGSYISATTGEIRGIPAAEPVLQVTFDLEAGGLSDGTSALFVISAFLQGDGGGPIILGTAAPAVMQLGFSAREGEGEPYKTQVAAQWTLSDAAIERIERNRNGGAMTLWPNFQYALINLGTMAPDWPQPQRPIRVPFPGQPTSVRIDAHQWAQDVLEQWQLAAAVSLVVALPAGRATDDHRTVADRLASAKRLLQAGKPDDLKASVAASREACEVLRGMLPRAVNLKPRQRSLPEREAVILEKTRDLTQALFDYDSASSHADPHLRNIVWRREDAILALGTAASLAQHIFART